ncbi:MAG: hypothetical protein IT368_14425, partial [Candidatus Hydrogenedentes bacterium]|nr:hypothetical protein [Candidatus Hydrogenedentota bacterium]
VELGKLADRVDDLRKQLTRSQYLIGRTSGNVKFLAAYWAHLQNDTIHTARQPLRFVGDGSPPRLTDLLEALADCLRADARQRRWKNKSKEQFMIDGVLISMNTSFGFGYPSFSAKIATLLCGGRSTRKYNAIPASIPTDVVLKRARNLKIPAR